MSKISDHLRDYCKGCGSFYVNGNEQKRRMLHPEESRELVIEVYSGHPDLFQEKIKVVEKCSLCPT